jgi:nucleoside phosphorylase
MDVAVLTVIPAELEAARAALGLATREKGADGTVTFRGAVRSELLQRDYEVVLACIGGAGNPGAAAAAVRIIAAHQPRAVLLMGIAAGVRGKVRIGDVVLSERVVAYEPAALVRTAAGSKVQPRPEIDRAPYTMLQDVMAYRADAKRLRHAFRKAGGSIPRAPAGKEELFKEHVATSVAAKLGTIASGEKLLRDPTKLIEIRETLQGKTDTGEMEAAGVVEACRPGNVPWLVIRGISDFGDELKDDQFHGFAARAAAAVLADFVGWGLDLSDRARPAIEEGPKLEQREPPEPPLVHLNGRHIIGISIIVISIFACSIAAMALHYDNDCSAASFDAV